jgi:uncharacterized protein
MVTDEQIAVKGEVVDLKPEIFQSIMGEVPLKVTVKNPKKMQGKNWEVISEAEYYQEFDEKIDPRLQKLQEFSFEDKQEE